MKDLTNTDHPQPEWLSLNETLQNGIELLCRAFRYAVESEVDVWQYSVEWKELRRLGLASCDIRCLIAHGWVQHAVELDRPGEDRLFHPAKGNELGERSCFVLSERAWSTLHSGSEPPRDPPETPPDSPRDPERNGRPVLTSELKNVPAGDVQPEWDGDRKELRLDGIVVKRFKWPAANQELILAVFQEEGWPAKIDDPLPSVAQQDPKRRLSDTIKCLNRKQVNPFIHFRGDGTGEGIVWELLQPDQCGDEAGN